MNREMRLSVVCLGLLAACGGGTPVEFSRLQVVSAKLSHSAGPPPHYGFIVCGSLELKNAPEGRSLSPESRPRRLLGREGSGDFVQGRGEQFRILNGVLTFRALIGEEAYYKATGFLHHDDTVRIEFEDPQGKRWIARGTLEHVKEFHSDLLHGLQADSK
jgi:hypothetical protein